MKCGPLRLGMPRPLQAYHVPRSSSTALVGGVKMEKAGVGDVARSPIFGGRQE